MNDREITLQDWDEALTAWATQCGELASTIREHGQRHPVPTFTVGCGNLNHGPSLTSTGNTLAEAKAAVYARVLKLIPLADVLDLSLRRIERRRRREGRERDDAREQRDREAREPARDER